MAGPGGRLFKRHAVALELTAVARHPIKQRLASGAQQHLIRMLTGSGWSHHKILFVIYGGQNCFESSAMLQRQHSFFACTLLIGCALLFAPLGALAQYNYYDSGAFAFNQNNYPPIGNQRWKKPSGTTPSKPVKIAPAPTAPESKAGRASANNNPLPYTRDKALSAQLRDEFLADFTKQMPPSDAADLRELLQKNDLVQATAGMVQLQKLDSSAMESVLAVWYGQSWAIANQKPLPTAQQYAGIAEQVKASMAASGYWSNLNNDKRQRAFEQLAYPLVVQQANYKAYVKQGKNDAIARMSSATQAGMKKIGLDMRAMQLSDTGLLPL